MVSCSLFSDPLIFGLYIEIEQLETEMVSNYNNFSEDLAFKKRGESISAEELGIEISFLDSEIKTHFNVEEPLTSDKTEIEVEVYLKKGNIISPTKTISIYSANSDRAQVIKTRKTLDDIIIITNRGISPVWDDRVFNYEAIDFYLEDGKMFKPYPNEILTLPEVPNEVSLTYKLLPSYYENYQTLFSVDISKGEESSIAWIWVYLKTPSINESDRYDVELAKQNLEKLAIFSTRDDIKEIKDPQPFSIEILENYGIVSGDIDFFNDAVLTYQLKQTKYNSNVWHFIITINKGLIEPEVATIVLTTSK